ncbi:transglutaminaseTgpA domain-containing protein [Microcella daejeonensis]|uniref:TransglutaminaseTgpA domain-containing protein n=1 Tax=Microcella daejeonensis TaxID=2994971 RepID=A0A9E8MLD9_9MICO|nr:transglutaminaseTgpA domain-containing protein [Microcella daejeonensis]WAB81672.1 transglutaminaseTgpA domain-containing protein [Microcella daejeonensis]
MAERATRARASAPAPGLTGPGSPAVGLALLLATGAALSGFTVLLEPEGPWFASTLVVAAIVLAAGLIVRRTAPAWARLWSVVAGVLALPITLIAMFALDALVPVGDDLLFEGVVRRIGELVLEGESGIAEQGIPAIAEDGIRFFLAAGIGALVLLADVAASALRRPALAAVPLLAVLAVPVVLVPGELPLLSVLATAVAFLLVLAVHRPAASGGGAAAGRAVGIAAAVVAVAVIAPLLLPAVVVGDRPTGAGVAAVTSGVNPVISLGDDLRRGAPVTVLRYSTTAEGGLYLTLSHLADFEGQEVQPVVRDAPAEPTDDVGPPAWFGEEVARSEATTDITLVNLRSRWVPLPSSPARVTDLDGSWIVDRDGLTMRSPAGPLRAGSYTVDSLVAEPTPEQLRAAGVTAPGLDRYRAVPDETEPIVAQTARTVVGDLAAPYEQALALQRFFTDGAFEYSEQAPVEGGYDGTGAEIVARFLEARSGYCVHYASAMTLMARTLGIPARIAVGLLPGTRDPDAPSEFAVSSDDLHAWPELHFDDLGWVRFEPTPSRGTTPAYATDDVPATDAPAEPGATPSPTPDPATPSDAPDPSATTPGPDGADPLVPSDAPGAGGDGAEAGAVAGFRPDPAAVAALAVVLLLAGLAAPGVVRALRRSRRRRSSDALDRWREVRDTARDLGLPAALTLTPRALADRWGAGDAAVRADLERVLLAAEARAFGAERSAVDPPVIDGVLAALRRQSPWWRRMLARVAPVSLLTRADDALLEPAAA